MPKYLNKYNNQSRRLQLWDYRNPGAYFITICTHNRQHFFGECQNGKMQLSTAGAIVQGFWYEIPKHFDHVQLGAFIVMPNHVHGILKLMDDDQSAIPHHGRDAAMPRPYRDGELPRPNNPESPNPHNETPDNNQNPTNNKPQYRDKRQEPGFYKKIAPKPGSVSTIIGSFKSVCTKHIRKSWPEMNFKWQERFHDHIIRDADSFYRISNYINNNPEKWKEDKFFEI